MVKAAVMFVLFLGPYALLVSGVVQHPALYFSLWALQGFGIAGLGMNVMHDANHGAFSRHKWVNRTMSLVMNLLGGDAYIWRMQHNVLHHTFTNIQDADEDIIGPPLLRFSPHDPVKKVHRYQYIYAWFMYSLMTLIKVAYTDFKRAIHFYKTGLISKKTDYRNRIIQIAIGKVFYFTYMVVIPMIFAPTLWWAIAGFFLMHLITGFLLSIIFQSAHVMPSSEYPLPNEKGELENNWAVHQIRTTTNFSPRSRFFSWWIGGLNYQVEHHLFSHISHVNYRPLSKIVAQTAREYGIPYHCEPSFGHALVSHGSMLHQLGNPPQS